MIKELMFEGSNRYFDQALCTRLTITDEDIDALCKVLIERDGKDYPSNAYAILTGHGGLHVAIQCGVFKGTAKEFFVDRREYTGLLWEQIDEATTI